MVAEISISGDEWRDQIMREQYDSALVRLEETGDSGNECYAGAPAYHS